MTNSHTNQANRAVSLSRNIPRHDPTRFRCLFIPDDHDFPYIGSIVFTIGHGYVRYIAFRVPCGVRYDSYETVNPQDVLDSRERSPRPDAKNITVRVYN